MKTLRLAIILIIGTSFLLAFSISNEINAHEQPISKQDCMGGPECPGSPPIPSASIGNRDLELALRLYSNSSMPDNTHYLWFRFFDAKTNQTVQHVSFFLTITNQNQSLFRELLHTHTGVLNVKVISTTGAQWNITGVKEPILGGWVPSNDDEPILAYAPVFNDTSSTYHLNIQMFSIDYDNNIFSNQIDTPNFNFYLNMKNQNKTITSPNVTVPEFPLAIPVLLIGITSLIAFSRIRTGFRPPYCS